MHAPGDGSEIVEIERIALEDESVKAELAKLQLPEGTVVISDPWIYGEWIQGRQYWQRLTSNCRLGRRW